MNFFITTSSRSLVNLLVPLSTPSIISTKPFMSFNGTCLIFVSPVAVNIKSTTEVGISSCVL